MTAQIIEFPVDRVRKPAIARSSRANSSLETPFQVRTSVRVVRAIIFWGALVAVFSALFFNGSADLSPAQANSESTNSAQGNFAYVTVMSGETLWSLAETYAPDQDPRDFIANLKALNNLSGTSLAPGMQLALPLN